MHVAAFPGAKALALAAALLATPAFAASPPSDSASPVPKAAEARPKAYNLGGALAIADNTGYQFISVTGPVRLDVGTITNESATNTSGTVRVALILTAGPAPSGTYWTVAQVDLGTLSPGFRFNPQSYTVPIASPPDGTYYVHMGVFEFEPTTCTTASGYCLDDYLSFENRVQVVGGQFFDAGPAPDPQSQVVEYYHANFNHYFVTSYPNEIAQLDAGAFQGWQRTGRTFRVWNENSAGDLAAVCRFWSASFAPRSSHFYTPYPDECDIVRANPRWQFEAVAFFVEYPDLGGNCLAGRQPLYRLYNNGQSGAPNHRYTTSLEVRQDMINRGWSPEGRGTLGVIACVPVRPFASRAPVPLPRRAALLPASSRGASGARRPGRCGGWREGQLRSRGAMDATHSTGPAGDRVEGPAAARSAGVGDERHFTSSPVPSAAATRSRTPSAGRWRVGPTEGRGTGTSEVLARWTGVYGEGRRSTPILPNPALRPAIPLMTTSPLQSTLCIRYRTGVATSASGRRRIHVQGDGRSWQTPHSREPHAAPSGRRRTRRRTSPG